MFCVLISGGAIQAQDAPAMLSGSRAAWATDTARLSTSVDLAPTRTITVMIKRAAQQQAMVDQLAAEQQRPGSPLYHKWVTPEQIGISYGPNPKDVQAITTWLTNAGLKVDSVAPTRTLVQASGSMQDLANAFDVTFSYYDVNGSPHLAANTMPSVPSALAPMIHSISGLSDPVRMKQPKSEDLYTKTTGSSNAYFMTPADFATIFDLQSVYSAANIGGAIGAQKQRVAILGADGVNQSDIDQYTQTLGLPTADIRTLNVNAPNANPANDVENTEDVERVIGTAPGVGVDLILIDTGTSIYFNIVSFNTFKLRDPVLTMSVGVCEDSVDSSFETQFDQLFQMSAMEGITTLISAGDTGAACGLPTRHPNGDTHRSINALCSSSYVTCMGGTSFSDQEDPSRYWAPTNGPGLESALSYIPEGTWNLPQVASDKYLVESGGGGVSIYLPRPPWQVGPGVPAGTMRVVPDISFPAAGRDGYFGCYQGACSSTTTATTGQGGTSASAPTMAGVVALLNTQRAARSGNINPLIYTLANSPSYNAIFHDVTPASAGVANCDASVPSRCNNSFVGPSGTIATGVIGFDLTEGYDTATGWGTLDVANFLAAAKTVVIPALP